MSRKDKYFTSFIRFLNLQWSLHTEQKLPKLPPQKLRKNTNHGQKINSQRIQTSSVLERDREKEFWVIYVLDGESWKEWIILQGSERDINCSQKGIQRIQEIDKNCLKTPKENNRVVGLLEHQSHKIIWCWPGKKRSLRPYKPNNSRRWMVELLKTELIICRPMKIFGAILHARLKQLHTQKCKNGKRERKRGQR